MSKSAVDSIGQGRVWTGEQALAIGLVDELGGLDRALEIAAERAELEKFSREDYPKEKDFFSMLTDGLPVRLKTGAARGLLDDVEFRHLMMLKNIRKQDAVQARMEFISEK
jgi:protease-4